MLTIISGTNRKDSFTKRVSLQYRDFLAASGVESNLVALDEIDIMDMINRGPAFKRLQEEVLVPTQKFIFILPEYNGTFPGILKLMIDCCDPRACYWHKKVLLTGVASGRAGNLRGMDHLSSSFLYNKMLVHPNRLPLSVVDKLLDPEGRFHDEGTIRAIGIQLQEFIEF